MNTQVLTGPCPGQAPQEQRGAVRVGEGEGWGRMGFPPLIDEHQRRKRAGQPGEACFRLRSRDPGACTGSTEPRSARRTGPSVPGGQGLRLLRRWGLTSHGAGSSSGDTRGNTPTSRSSQRL